MGLSTKKKNINSHRMKYTSAKYFIDYLNHFNVAIIHYL